MPHAAQPLVSIVMPTYRAARYVNEAMSAVAAQTYRHWELLVCDDGSPAAEVAAYRLPPGAQLLRTPVNSGRAAVGRNRGFRAARGSLVALLDQDDSWEPEKLERQVALLARQPAAALAVCGWWVVGAAGQVLAERRPWVAGYRQQPATFLRHGLPAPPCSFLIRRAALCAVGLCSEDVETASDSDLFFRLSLLAPVAVDPALLLRYRRHPEQVSRQETRTTRGRLHWMRRQLGSLPASRPELRRPLVASLSHLELVLARLQAQQGDSTAWQHALAGLRLAWWCPAA